MKYRADRYLRWPEIESFCRSLPQRCPELFRLTEIGTSRGGRPILLVTVGLGDEVERRPAIWVDGGTHASEFTGVMATLHALESWASRHESDDAALFDQFATTTAFVAPCLSPDGYDYMREGGPFIRSTLRPPPAGAPLTGWEPSDMDGDGIVRQMRWRHPAGPMVPDDSARTLMRPRTLDDDPNDAWFVASEGRFVDWDGHRWVQAPRRFGIDLNRNFPAGWAPFSMFGMDSGAYATSEPESRAAVEAVRNRPTIAAALSHHTYTGCILTQPYAKESPLSDAEIRLMHDLASDLVEGTGYRVYKVHPEFTYDPKSPVVGVWSDTLATVFGIPGYTVEFWDPFGAAGIDNTNPVEFFRDPDVNKIKKVVGFFESEFPELVQEWTPFQHPQLGEVEVGGLDYLQTIRNPPPSRLVAELEIGTKATERLLNAVPRVVAHLDVERAGDATRVTLVLENTGYLSTAALRPSQECPGVSACIELDAGRVLDGAEARFLEHLDGWGVARATSARNAVYPGLPAKGHRQVATWWVEGASQLTIRWTAGRAGAGTETLSLEPQRGRSGQGDKS